MIFWKNGCIAYVLFVLTFFFSSNFLSAQSSSEIYHELLKLKETKRILYIAAHPDDENTRLIAYLGNREHAEVAYLSLTRGDGGQNLIGKQLGLELGMIRTQELLRARETDGGRQFFTRAIDFGFSKNPDETLNNWDKEKLLSDVVWIIRNYQPDIIINRFNSVPGTTHGHHTTSAILSLEAFKAAADPKAFPEQLTQVKPWETKRIFWNGYNWGSPYKPESGKLYHSFPVGEFNSLMGTTYSQIAADSRTMHKSQGFGATAQVGKSEDFIEMIDGQKFNGDPFEGLVNRWSGIENGPLAEAAIGGVLENFNFLNPEENLKGLIEVKRLLYKLETIEPWVSEKQGKIDEVILNALGIKAEFISDKELSYPSDKVNTSLIINNPSRKELQVASFSYLNQEKRIAQHLANNETISLDLPLTLPEDFPISQPYWIEQAPGNNLYQIENQAMIGKPFNNPAIAGRLVFEIEGLKIIKSLPLKYKYNDPVDGEINQPFTVVPEIQLAVDKENVFLLNGQPETIAIHVSFEDKIVEGVLAFEGLSSGEYKQLEKKVDEGGKQITYKIQLDNIATLGKKTVEVKYQTDKGVVYDKCMKRISYKHIPNLTYFPTSAFNLITLSLDISSQKVGYIPGAGDDIPDVLTSLGYSVTLLENGQLDAARLSQFNTVIIGIRAFNISQNLASHVDDLMEYVYSGGNLIVQYNTSAPLLATRLGPYPFQLSRDRVAVEDSPVKIVAGSHSVLTSPNMIELKDFEGWVQERGLYFPASWDSHYNAPLIMRDPDESETRGSLLLTNYGEGTYTYSGISWFRLLPAGVPGAIKLFVNLIEQGRE